MRRAKFTSHASDFILKDGVMPILLAEPYSPVFKQVVERLSADPLLQVVECGAYADAVGIARKIGTCLVLIHAPNPKDFSQQLQLLKNLNKEIQNKTIRVIVTSKTTDQIPPDSKLEVFGCSEFIREPIQEKSLVFKMEKHIRTLMQGQKGKIQAAQSGGNHESIGFIESPELFHASLETIRLLPELKIENDFWLLAGGGAKIVGGRWTVRLVGPGPAAGHWLKSDYVAEIEESGVSYWEWTPTNTSGDTFIKNGGTWIFRGQRPEFQNGLWQFVSKNPELFFYRDLEKLGSKLIQDEHDILCVTKDSTIAREFLALIKSSLNKKLSTNSNDKKIKAAPTIRARDALVAGVTQEGVQTKATNEALPYRLVQPLQIKSDCWLLQKRRPRWIGGRWVIKLLGPGPSTGTWLPYSMPGEISEKLRNSDERFWQWAPNSDPDLFVVEEGAWIFFGLMPKIEDDQWLFVGKTLSLSFVHNSVSKGDRITVDSSGTLLIAWDSEYAKEMLPKLEQSQVDVMKVETIAKPVIVAAAIPVEPAPVHVAEPVVAAPVVAEPVVVESIVSEPVIAAAPVEAAIPAAAVPIVADAATSVVPATPGPIPSGLSLSPLALALIVSELASEKNNSALHVAQRFSGYLSSTCHGARIEVWKKGQNSQWVCMATHDGSEGKYQAEAEKTDIASTKTSDGKVIAPVLNDIHETGKILGAVILDNFESSKVSLQFLQAAAQAVCSVIKS